jgi:hypothetical protein
MSLQHVNPFDPPASIYALESMECEAIVIQGLHKRTLEQDEVSQKLQLAQIGVCDIYLSERESLSRRNKP